MSSSIDDMPPQFVYNPITVSYKKTMFNGKTYSYKRTLKGKKINPEYLKYIKAFMKEHNMTYIEYAKRLKCSKGMISRANYSKS